MEGMTMTAELFNERLRELSAMVGSAQATELFNQSYEDLMMEVKALPGPRFEMFTRMRSLLMHQAEYLMREWIREHNANQQHEAV